jgi:ABC-type nitrate/sulfonate/bicarbonate transport system ATPase subunit/ABC-type nitrate/sulfonate/bicarbonate transport system permease component
LVCAATIRRVMMPLSIAVFLALWQIAALAVDSVLILPAPADVLAWITHNVGSPVFLRHIGASSARTFIAAAVTIAAGSVLGVCAGLRPVFRRFISFPLTVIRAAPVVSIILLAVFWLGTDALPVFIAALMALPVMIDSVAAGIQKTPARLRDAMRVYGFSRAMLLRHVYIPGAAPAFFSGARSVFGMCWKAVAAGEVLALPRFGAGSLLYGAKVHLETTEVFAVTAVLIVLCFAFEGIFSLCAKAFSCTKRKKKTLPAGCLHIPTERTTPPYRLRVQNLCVSRGGKELFRSFSVDFEAGKITAIIAASGRGKTTLLDCIAGILAPAAGRISLDYSGTGHTIQDSFKTAYLFQEPLLLPWRTIEQNIFLANGKRGSGGASDSARYFLEKSGLAARASAFPHELSGGERQRAALARAFCYPAPVLLMDEAFQSQDLPLKLVLMELAKSFLREESRAVILVTHDVREALCLAERILVLSGEPLVIALDIAVPKSECEDCGAAISDRYVRLPDRLLAAEADILDALSRDRR